jgi:hypothetical protein
LGRRCPHTLGPPRTTQQPASSLASHHPALKSQSSSAKGPDAAATSDTHRRLAGVLPVARLQLLGDRVLGDVQSSASHFVGDAGHQPRELVLINHHSVGTPKGVTSPVPGVLGAPPPPNPPPPPHPPCVLRRNHSVDSRSVCGWGLVGPRVGFARGSPRCCHFRREAVSTRKGGYTFTHTHTVLLTCLSVFV